MDILDASLEDLKKYRPDLCYLLYDEFSKAQSLKKTSIKDDADINVAKLGDLIRWNYTGEEGVVVGFESFDGTKRIVVEQYDGTRIRFENNSKLYQIIDICDNGVNLINKKKTEVLNKRKIEELSKKHGENNSPIIEGVKYETPTRNGSNLKLGDRILYRVTKKIGEVIGFIRKGGIDRIVMKTSKGIPPMIIDNVNLYDIIKGKTKKVIHTNIDSNKQNDDIKAIPPKKAKKNEIAIEALVGDYIFYDDRLCKVVKKKTTGRSMRLIIEYEDGTLDNVPNDWNRYRVKR